MACDRATRRQSAGMLYRSQTLCVLSVCVLWACGADGGAVPPGAEVELDGGGSAYEPEPTVNAGAPAVAGRTLAVTGGTAGGAGGAVSTPTPTPAPTKPADPSPRWVLRSASGAAVQADVWPGYAADAPRFADSPTTVLVRFAGQRRLQLTFSLATGALVADNGCSASDWHSMSAACPVYYADSTCTQQPTLGMMQSVYVVGGKAHYTGSVPSTATSAWYWTGTACAAVTGSSLGTWYPLAAMPSDLAGLLPSAPYSLELVY